MNRLSELSTIVSTTDDFKIRARVLNFEVAWRLCVQNRDELYRILDEVTTVANIEIIESYESLTQEIYRRLVNHLGTIFLLKELIEGEMHHLKNIDREIIEFSSITGKLFGNNRNSHFVVKLRNHVIHNRPFTVDIQSLMNTEHELMKSVVILDCEKLTQLGDWDPLAREYMKENFPYINLKECLDEYHSVQEVLYTWFISRLNEKYSKEISRCKVLEDEYGDLINKEKEKVKAMSLKELSNLPRIEEQGSTGFSITKVR